MTGSRPARMQRRQRGFTGTAMGAEPPQRRSHRLGVDREPVLHIWGSARRRAYEFAEKNGAQGVLMVRLMPILSADAMNLVAGAARMPFRKFMLASAAGALPVTALVVWLSRDNTRMMWGLGWLSLLVGAAFLGRWWYSRRGQAGRNDQGTG